MSEQSLYQELKQANIPLKHWQSSLYAKVTPISKDIVEKRNIKGMGISIFGLENEQWYDFPFECDPFWECMATNPYYDLWIPVKVK